MFGRLIIFLKKICTGELNKQYPYAEFDLQSIKVLNLIVTSKTELYDYDIKNISRLVNGELIDTNIDEGDVFIYTFRLDYKESKG